MANIIYPLGHLPVSNYIVNMLKDNMLHRALIFSGKKGIGKAMYAKSLAKFLLSHNLAYFNKVQDIQDLSQGQENIIALINARSHPDYLYIKPAEKLVSKIINIEQIRNITNSLVLTSDNDKYKVVIIDALDDMNLNACNALLKVLEETPQNVIFILISHNYNNILPTIKSRCLNIPFNKLTTDVLKVLSEKNAVLNGSIILEDILEYADGSYTNLLEIINNANFYIILKELINTPPANYNISIWINKYSKEIKETDWQVLIGYLKTILIKTSFYEVDKKQKILSQISKYAHDTNLLNLDKTHVLYMLLLLITKS